MLRNEIQRQTGLTRKAIEYYEERGLINPKRLENSYRDYTDKDLEILKKISLFRKLNLSTSEIEMCLFSDENSISSILRDKQHKLEIEEKRKEILYLILRGKEENIVYERVALIEIEETIYEKLERLFPGYFGQMMFAAYKPFLNETLEKDQEEAFKKYVDYLDMLPSFKLSKDEKKYIEKMSSNFDMKSLNDLNKEKIEAVFNPEDWIKENEEMILNYENYKNSEEYQNSIMKKIEDKLKRFMKDNNYYEIAIPLIRKFSKSYDDYYDKLLKANDIYIDRNK